MTLKSYTIIGIILTLALVPNSYVYAGGPRFDGPETSDPEVGMCWIDGFDGGANNDYSKERFRECQEPGSLYEGANQYREAFDIGLRCLNPVLYEYINEDCDAAREEAKADK
jgi:hypothetical protein